MGRKKKRKIPFQQEQSLDDAEKAERKRRSKIVKKGDFTGPDDERWIGCMQPIDDAEDDGE